MTIELGDVNERFADAGPLEIVAWAHQTFGDGLVMTSSFQTQSVPLLHVLSRVAPEVPVLFLDTGFHFPETLAFRHELAASLGLSVIDVRNELGHAGFLREHGDLHRTDSDACCYLNKVAPLEKALAGRSAWLTGIRKDQTAQRADTPAVSLEDDRYKVCPLVNWTDRDVAEYVARHALPQHPLHASGYRSIGCAPCTRPTVSGEDARAGRWSGTDKTECGLHFKTTDRS